MKNTPHIQNLDQRDESDPRAERHGSDFPKVSHNYQNSQLTGSCGSPAKFQHPAFSEISQKYFADEAARGFLVDTGLFGALLLAAMLPIVNGVEAVGTLIQTLGVL
jgi:hypothetical protein